MTSNREALALGSNIYGGRPAFVLTYTVKHGGDPAATLYELMPERQAKARRERMNHAGRPVKILSFEKAVNNTVNSTGFERWGWDDWMAVKVSTLTQNRLEAASNLIKDTLDEANTEQQGIVKEKGGSIPLAEPAGIRLAIAFIGMKPIQRIDRLHAFARAIARMSTEECYYWHAKCRSPHSPNGAKALRVLLTDHIQ